MLVIAEVLRSSDLSGAKGYCFVSADADPPGISLLLRADNINILYAIPSALQDLEVFFSSPSSMPVGRISCVTHCNLVLCLLSSVAALVFCDASVSEQNCA